MNHIAMVLHLESLGCVVTTLGNDVFHVENDRGLPDEVWNLSGWVVSSSCGYGRIYLMKA